MPFVQKILGPAPRIRGECNLALSETVSGFGEREEFLGAVSSVYLAKGLTPIALAATSSRIMGFSRSWASRLLNLALIAPFDLGLIVGIIIYGWNSFAILVLWIFLVLMVPSIVLIGLLGNRLYEAMFQMRLPKSLSDLEHRKDFLFQSDEISSIALREPKAQTGIRRLLRIHLEGSLTITPRVQGKQQVTVRILRPKQFQEVKELLESFFARNSWLTRS